MGNRVSIPAVENPHFLRRFEHSTLMLRHMALRDTYGGVLQLVVMPMDKTPNFTPCSR